MRGEGTHDPGSRGGKAHTSGTPVLGAGRPSSSLENSSPASDQLLSEGSGPLSQPGPEAGRGPRALPLGPLKHPWGYYTFLRMRLTERRDWSLLLLPVRMEELESKVHSEQIDLIETKKPSLGRIHLPVASPKLRRKILPKYKTWPECLLPFPLLELHIGLGG